MEEENKITVQLFEDMIEKRRKLIALKNKVIQANNQKDSFQYADDLLNITYENESRTDFSSDDSVMDKNYEPDRMDCSSYSEISNSPDLSPRRYLKNKVKKRLFSPAKSNEFSCKKQCTGMQKNHEACNNQPQFETERNSIDQEKVSVSRYSDIADCPNKSFTQNETLVEKNNNLELDLITLEDLFGQQQNNGHSSSDFLSLPTHKKSQFHVIPTTLIDICGYLSDDCDSSSIRECYNKTNLENQSLTDNYKNDNNLSMSNLNINSNYPTMVVDSNGVVYMSCNVNSNSSEGDFDLHESPATTKFKKKIVDKTKWKRNSAKILRLKGSPYQSAVANKKVNVVGRAIKDPCSCRSKCFDRLPFEKRQLIFNQFWKLCQNWDQRRQYVTQNVKKVVKKIMKTGSYFDLNRRKFSYIYFLTYDQLSIKVCKKMFINTLSIGEKFVKLSIEKQFESGLTENDMRGKHEPANKSSEPLVKTVVDHIKSYPVYDSHYSRQKSEKKYLGHDLNVATMYKHYIEHMATVNTPAHFIAKEWLYRHIFSTKFNLSFKLPSLDTCDDCDAYERKMRDAASDQDRTEINRMKKLHDAAAEERYNLKKRDKEEAKRSSGKKIVLMFDLQKCLATPNLTNTKSFYLRKLWTLNLTIYDATFNVATNLIWSENISGRGGNEIASCIIRWALENKNKILSVEEVTFWSDNCAGQNRNSMIIMAYIWLLHKFPHLKVINHKFMLKGHTHMEVDQIHSQIERKKKKLKTMQIAIPRDWSQFIRTCGGQRPFVVYDMGLQHFKDVTTLYKKHGSLIIRKKNKKGQEFKISKCVWLQLRQVKPGVVFYKTDFTTEFTEISFVRNEYKGISFPNELPILRKTEKPISTAKYNDLITLLQWVPQEFHSFYRNLRHTDSESDFPEID